MPRVKPRATDIASGIIAKGMKQYRLDDSEMAMKVRMSVSCWFTRKRNPDQFRLAEFKRLVDTVGMSDAEILEIVRAK